MMHLRHIGQLEAYLEEEHAGQRHTITAILPREKVEELYRRLVGDAWRGIETAPKNMKVLAGYFNEAGKWRTVTATYYEDGVLESYEDQHESGFAPEGWYEESETHEDLLQMTTPTHWQPLPSPPKEPNP